VRAGGRRTASPTLQRAGARQAAGRPAPARPAHG
jgi:hypothetical protein